MIFNIGNVSLESADLYIGWNGEYYYLVKDQGKALVVNGGTVNLDFVTYTWAIVYINGEKQRDSDEPCNPVADNDETSELSEVVNAPTT